MNLFPDVLCISVILTYTKYITDYTFRDASDTDIVRLGQKSFPTDVSSEVTRNTVYSAEVSLSFKVHSMCFGTRIPRHTHTSKKRQCQVSIHNTCTST